MGIKCGIVGLPNVGKSTLFNALTKAGIAAENYPFCTIDPNVGVVPVPDARLDELAGHREARRSWCRRRWSSWTSPVSWPALPRARVWATSSCPISARPMPSPTWCAASRMPTWCTSPARWIPLSDIETINTELALADLEAVSRGVERNAKVAKSGDKDAVARQKVLEALKAQLDQAKPARGLGALAGRAGHGA